ncbi:MAG: hypothetical protein L3J06_08410 [Cyclobacteriaceae bacterium]|nr:hypothetical protein [Cyclobacteriaceae bacterium]
MNTVIKIGLFLILLIITSAIFAQEVEKQGITKKLKTSGYLNLQEFQDDEVFLQQVGYNNSANIAQYSQLNRGNKAFVVQYGEEVNVLLTQLGMNNLATLRQNGYRNFIEVTELGNSISTEVVQFGNNNKVQQELGSNGMKYSIIQQGFGHEVVDLGFSPESPGYTIRQTGMVGMKVAISSR